MKVERGRISKMTELFIVEDDKVLADGLARALKADDRRIECFGKLSQARRILAERQPDLLILDVNLPDGSGYCGRAGSRPALSVSSTVRKIFEQNILFSAIISSTHQKILDFWTWETDR